MTTRVPVALPWYNRHEYPALLSLFSDPDKMPKTFDAWLEHAEKVEKQLQAAGFAVARMPCTQAQDAIHWGDGRPARSSNRAGGTEGGTTNGEPLILRGAMKPMS